MANKHKGQKRKALKKKFDKIKRVEKNNLKAGHRFAITSLSDLRSADLKNKMK